MAQIAQKLPIPTTTDTSSARLIAMPPTGMPLNLVESDNSAKSWLINVARVVGSACRTAKDYRDDIFNGAGDRSRQMGSAIGDCAEVGTKERPLKVLAGAASVAIVVGVATRVWRYNRHE